MPRILVIEDDPNVREGIATYLHRLGHDVLEAADGRQALKAISGKSVDLVITDINMPDMDGIEVINAFRANAPVIAISGGGKVPKDFLLKSAQILGAVATLAKPFQLEDLRKAVESALSSSERNTE